MGQAAINAATNTHTQLASIFPSLSSAQLWNMEAMTLLPGIDDYPKKTEVTSLSDAQSMLNFAQANNMNLLSIWAIQRDNGGCPGTRRQQHLLRHHPEHLGLQPPARAIHRLTPAAARRQPPRHALSAGSLSPQVVHTMPALSGAGGSSISTVPPSHDQPGPARVIQ